MDPRKTKHISTKRIHWIDVCRGIAIILVLYGHTFASDRNDYLIFAFHMPLFFFISGLVFKPLNFQSFKKISFKYFKQLLIPYYLFALVTYGFTLISQTAGDVSLGGIAYQLYGILYGNGNNGMLGFNVVLWFLPCLFITKLTFAAITKKLSQTKAILAILFASGLIGYLISVFAPWLKLPFSFEIAFTSITFFGAGYLLSRHKYLLTSFIQNKKILAVTALLFTILIATYNYYLTGAKVDLRINQLDNIFLFYLGAFGGIISWITISRILAKNVILEYIGRHSMVLFVWHNVLFTDIRNLTTAVVSQDFFDSINAYMPTFLVTSGISIILFGRLIFSKLKVVALRVL